MESRPSPSTDWQPRRIHAAIHDVDLTLSQISREAGYHDTAAWNAIYRYRHGWPKMKRIIADRIGVAPHEIWPSIFDEHDRVRPGVDRRKLPRYLTRGHGAPRPEPEGAK